MPTDIKQAHYKFSPEMRPRYKEQPSVTKEALMLRGFAFDLFDVNLVKRPTTPSLISSVFETFDRLLFTLPRMHLNMKHI